MSINKAINIDATLEPYESEMKAVPCSDFLKVKNISELPFHGDAPESNSAKRLQAYKRTAL